MRTVVLGPRPPELDALIARRHALGQDIRDEVWEGDYHMAPAPQRRHARLAFQLTALVEELAGDPALEGHADFNLGEPGNYRIPDGGLIHCEVGGESFVPTAALVIEVRSPDDETMLKFDHYAAHGVSEVLVADPDERAIELYVLDAGIYSRREMSPLLGATVADVAARLRWPQQH